MKTGFMAKNSVVKRPSLDNIMEIKTTLHRQTVLPFLFSFSTLYYCAAPLDGVDECIV